MYDVCLLCIIPKRRAVKMGANLFNNYGEAVAMILFVIGCGNLMLQSNLIKKIIGLNIMDTAVYLLYFREGGSHRSRWDTERGSIY
jgi:multisubunit Na+/H+ antiporter MnhC subunit